MGIMDAVGGALGKAGAAVTPSGQKGKTAIEVIKIAGIGVVVVSVVAIPVYLSYRFIKGVDRFSIAAKPISGGAPLIEDPTLTALSGLGMGVIGDAAWRPAIEVLKNGVWTRRWTGNYNFTSSDDAISFVKTTVGVSAFIAKDETYRVIAEQQEATQEVVTQPGTVLTQTVTTALTKGTPPPDQNQVPAQPPATQPQLAPKTTETSTVPPDVINPTDEAAVSPSPTVMDRLKNLSLPLKIGMTVGIAGAIGGAALLLSKKKK